MAVGSFFSHTTTDDCSSQFPRAKRSDVFKFLISFSQLSKTPTDFIYNNTKRKVWNLHIGEAVASQLNNDSNLYQNLYFCSFRLRIIYEITAFSRCFVSLQLSFCEPRSHHLTERRPCPPFVFRSWSRAIQRRWWRSTLPASTSCPSLTSCWMTLGNPTRGLASRSAPSVSSAKHAPTPRWRTGSEGTY